MVKFSRRGDRVTEFERALIAEASSDHLTDARALLLELARRIGVDALVVVMDELGGEKFHVPQREEFFRSLWKPIRDAEIARRVANGEPKALVAAEFELTVRRVRDVAGGSAPDAASAAAVVDGRP